MDDSIRQIRPPLTSQQLAPLKPGCRVVQFADPLKPDEHARLANFLRAYPEVPLRAYGHYGHQVKDLSFLRHYPGLREFQVDLFELESLDGVEHLDSGLQFFALGATRTKKLDLGFLGRFSALKELCLESHTKGIQVLSRLRSLERLTLRSITLPDPSLLQGLDRLWWLALRLGGTSDLAHLPGGLKYLELWMVKGLSDLSPIERLESLQFLFLQSLKQVTRLPRLTGLKDLRRVYLEGMKGLRDLSPLGHAPALEELDVVVAQHMQPEDFRPLREHPTLKRFFAGLGSLKRNQLAHEVVGLPAATATTEFRFQ
jgi:hypothetical protein